MAAAPVAAAEVRPEATLDAAQARLVALRQEGAYWSMPAYSGAHHVSQYFVLQRWLRIDHTKLKPEILRTVLLDSQQADGSWQAVYDGTYDGGSLDATIFNYWALKVMGEDTESRVLSRARQFVLARGGVEAAQVATKIFLALTDNYSWSMLPKIPYLLFMPLSPVRIDQFAPWVAPHLAPLAYLRQVRAARQLGPGYELRELFASTPPQSFGNATAFQPVDAAPGEHRKHVKRLLGEQQADGSWGGHTVATMLTLAALQDYGARWPLSATDVGAARAKALGFIEHLSVGSGTSAYLGVTTDGTLWDTALATNTLLDAGVAPEALESSLDLLAKAKPPRLSLDATAQQVLALSRSPRHRAEVDRAVALLLSLQNSDGGFAAESRNNTSSFMLTYFAGEFADSTDLFDESSADVTGHVLEALAKVGKSRTNSVAVQKAITFLRSAQNGDGSFSGRWGVNTLYGTGAAVVGLLKAGLPAEDRMLVKALDYLAARQNADGGFGETPRSYVDPALRGQGISTPTQTAWALLALLEDRERFRAQIDKAAGYLLSQFETDGRWIDRSAVGTGHPGIAPMHYPSYAYAFPLQALAKYRVIPP